MICSMRASSFGFLVETEDLKGKKLLTTSAFDGKKNRFPVNVFVSLYQHKFKPPKGNQRVSFFLSDWM